MQSQRVGAHPPTHQRIQVPLPEVLQPDFYILLLAREPIILPEALPPLRPVIALRAAVGLVAARLDELTRCLVDDDAGRAEMVPQREEDVQAIFPDIPDRLSTYRA